MGSPTALQSEKRPPTQSFMGNTFSDWIPKASIAARLVDTATKWSATAFSPNASTSHFLAVVALDKVSCVVNVLDTTTKRVVAGLTFFSTSIT